MQRRLATTWYTADYALAGRTDTSDENEGQRVQGQAFTVTGQEVTVRGRRNIIVGYQRGTATRNMKSTVIADKQVTVAQLCAAPDAAAGKAAGI